MRNFNVGVMAALVALCVTKPCAAQDKPAAAPVSSAPSSQNPGKTTAGAGVKGAARVGSLSADEERRASRARKRAEATQNAAKVDHHGTKNAAPAASKEEGRADAAVSTRGETTRASSAPAASPTPEQGTPGHATAAASAPIHTTSRNDVTRTDSPVRRDSAATRPSHKAKSKYASRHRDPRIGDVVPRDAELSRLPQRYGYPPRYAENDEDEQPLPLRRRFYYTDPRFGPAYPPYPSPYGYAPPAYYPRPYFGPP